MPEKTLKLAEGRSVPMEDGKAWPSEGATVEVTLYIRRRLADGDLVECGPLPPPAADEPIDPAPAPSDPDSEPETVQTHTGRKGRNGGK